MLAEPNRKPWLFLVLYEPFRRNWWGGGFALPVPACQNALFYCYPNFNILDSGIPPGESWLKNTVHHHTPTLCHSCLWLSPSFRSNRQVTRHPCGRKRKGGAPGMVLREFPGPTAGALSSRHATSTLPAARRAVCQQL